MDGSGGHFVIGDNQAHGSVGVGKGLAVFIKGDPDGAISDHREKFAETEEDGVTVATRDDHDLSHLGIFDFMIGARLHGEIGLAAGGFKDGQKWDAIEGVLGAAAVVIDRFDFGGQLLLELGDAPVGILECGSADVKGWQGGEAVSGEYFDRGVGA